MPQPGHGRAGNGLIAGTRPERLNSRALRTSLRAIEEFGALSARPEDIPEPAPCYACGGATVKTAVEYEYTYQCNDESRVTASKTLPGYRCQACDAVYLDPGLDERFLGIVGQALAGLVDRHLQDALGLRGTDPETFTEFTPPLPRTPRSRVIWCGPA